jgi:hypothetical protein
MAPLTTTILGKKIAIANYSRNSRIFCARLDHPGVWNHALVLVSKTNLWVGSDWLISSSKLQSCLELCRFAQVPLKTKVAIWKAHFLHGICEKSLVQHSSEQMVYYSRYATEKKGVPLESRSYAKSHPSPKITASLWLRIESLPTFVSNSCLTFLNSTCLPFTPNQVHSLVHIQHQAISCWFYTFTQFPCWSSCIVDFEQVPYMVSVHFQAIVMISLVPSTICLVRVSKGMSSSTVPKIDSLWKFLPQWRMSSLTLELENVLSHSEYPARVAGPRRLSNEAQNK